MAKDIDFLTSADFGSGIDTLHVNVRGNAVKDRNNNKPTNVGEGTGQVAKFSLLRTKRLEDYESALTVNAEASATFGLFGGSASLSFAKQERFHEFSEFLVVSFQVFNAVKRIPDPVLTQSASNLLATGQIERFQQEFGDSFVISITAGGLYYAVLQFISSSEAEQQAISAALQASEFGLFSGQASFSQAFQSIKVTSQIRVDSFQMGGIGEGVSANIDVDKILERAEHFPKEVEDNAVNVSMAVQDYLSLDLPPVNLVDIEAARQVLRRYTDLRKVLVQVLGDINYVQLHTNEFINPNLPDLAAKQLDVQNALDTLTASASACVSDVKNCKFAAPVMPSVDLPARRVATAADFAGQWTIDVSSHVEGTDVPGRQITRLVISPEDDTHALVRGEFDGHLPVTERGEWNADTKALQVALKVRDEAESNKRILFPALFHNLSIRVVPGVHPKFDVTDDFGMLIAPTESHLTFNKAS